MASAYKAYRAAGKASGSYKASLYAQQSIGAERSYEDFMSEYRQGEMSEVIGFGTEALGVSKSLFGEGGYTERKAEAKEAVSGLQKAGFTVEEQKRSGWDIATGKDKMYKFAKPGEKLTDFTTDTARIKQEYNLYKEDQMGLTSTKKMNTWDEASNISASNPPDKDIKSNKEGDLKEKSWWDRLFKGTFHDEKKKKGNDIDVKPIEKDKNIDTDKVGSDAWLRKKSLDFAKKRQMPAFAEGGGLEEYNQRLLDISGEEGWSAEEQRWTY